MTKKTTVSEVAAARAIEIERLNTERKTLLERFEDERERYVKLLDENRRIADGNIRENQRLYDELRASNLEIKQLHEQRLALRSERAAAAEILRYTADTGNMYVLQYVVRKVVEDLGGASAEPPNRRYRVAIHGLKMREEGYTYKISLIKWVRERRNLGLKEAKDVVDLVAVATPEHKVILDEHLSAEEAKRIADEVEPWTFPTIVPE